MQALPGSPQARNLCRSLSLPLLGKTKLSLLLRTTHHCSSAVPGRCMMGYWSKISFTILSLSSFLSVSLFSIVKSSSLPSSNFPESLTPWTLANLVSDSLPILVDQRRVGDEFRDLVMVHWTKNSSFFFLVKLSLLQVLLQRNCWHIQ